MALPTSGNLSIKTAAGTTRSIAQEVDGNTVGNKSLVALQNSANIVRPAGMTDFYGFSALRTVSISFTSGTSSSGSSESTLRFISLNATNTSVGDLYRVDVQLFAAAQKNNATVGNTLSARSAIIEPSGFASADATLLSSVSNGIDTDVRNHNFIVSSIDFDNTRIDLRVIDPSGSADHTVFSSVRITSVMSSGAAAANFNTVIGSLSERSLLR